MTESHTKRFVGAAWTLLSFQMIASVGAVAVTGLAAMHVAGIARDLEASRQIPAQAQEQAARPQEPPATGDRSGSGDIREQATIQQPPPAAVPVVVAQCTPSDGVIRVPANVEWCDTSIVVRRGQRIAISAEGRWNYRGQPAFGPAGSGERLDTTLAPRAPLAALIGRVGDEVFLIGQGGQSQAASEGRLYLSINDVSGTFGDNAGFMNVYVQFPEERR